MNNRGQVQVLWVILEIALVIMASFGMFTLINRADDDTRPEQQFLAKEVALTREAIDLYAGGNLFYKFGAGMTLDYAVAVREGKVSVGIGEEDYLSNSRLEEHAYAHPEAKQQTLFFELGGREVYVSNTADQSRALFLPCEAKLPDTIALVPLTSEATVFANLLAPQNKKFTVTTDAKTANAEIAVLIMTTPTERAVARFVPGTEQTACAFVNGLASVTPAQFTTNEQTGMVPISVSYDLPPAYAPFIPTKPYIILELGVPVPRELQAPYLKAKADQMIARVS